VRSNRIYGGVLLVLALLIGAAACDDVSGFQVDPLLATDTVDVYAPLEANAELPTALDIVARNLVIGGGRFPERTVHAGQWDFAVRVREGEMVLVPAGALGLEYEPLLTRALAGQSFEALTRAPERAAFVADSAVVMRTGSVYAARSRLASTVFGACNQYAKLQPLEVDPVAGSLRLLITTNEQCGDNRLTN
jgi:hypothetical protein